jgi:hypothetical protein
MKFFQEKPELISKICYILIISNYTIESIIIYWWNTHGSMIHISTFIYCKKMLTDNNLNYFRQTTESFVLTAHIRLPNVLVYQKSIELSKAPIWVIYFVKVLILLSFFKFLFVAHFK